MSRGNARQDIVLDDADREKRLDWLRRTVEVYGWRMHAFVLMRNHDHLFIETPEPNLSAGMQYLNGSYTSYFNRRHRRCGHLFQGRFKGHLIEERGYFLEVSRYIHLNPVRAKVVARPEQYPWSSYGGYQRASRTVAWVTYDQVLGEFGVKGSIARRAYTRFVRAGVEKAPTSPFAEALERMLLGSDTFVARIRRLLDDRPTDHRCPPTGADPQAAATGGDHRRCRRAFSWSWFWTGHDTLVTGPAERRRESGRCGIPSPAPIRVSGHRSRPGPRLPQRQ